MDDKPTLTREERLAQKLRDNLRRRKAQARELGTAGETAAGAADGGQSPETLSKAPPSR